MVTEEHGRTRIFDGHGRTRMNTDWIGRSHERVGARDRVTGALRYTADLSFDDALHVKLVHLSGARFGIGAIDRRKDLEVPGGAWVLVPDALPQPMPRYGPAFADRPILATGETKFFGEPVAAVVAETRDGAEAGAAAGPGAAERPAAAS